MKREDSSAIVQRNDGITEPLRHPIFRRIWFASLASNLGLLIQGVGAAWAMTELASAPDMVALVQTALMLPVMLLAVPAGAAADMYDRRRVMLLALLLSLSGAALLSALAVLDLITPPILLLFTFIIGGGMALFGPAWQASVSEQVPADSLPAAIALNGISFNIARSFGPAIGGVIVATAGAVAAFAVNALLYLPLLAVLLSWRRIQEPSRLPPERLSRAIVSGTRYILNSPPIRDVLARTFLFGLAGGSISALMPLVARDLVSGAAQTYGVLLGCFGVGAVAGAVNLARIGRKFDNEQVIRLGSLTLGVAICVVGLSRSPLLTGGALVVAGVGWMISLTLFNVGIQLSVPRWVAGRALAGFQAAIAGGLAIGSWVWGHATAAWGVDNALLVSGVGMALLPLVGRWLRMPESATSTDEALEARAEPEVNLKLTGRSGPIVVEVEYRVALEDARAFYRVMQEVEPVRKRNGAYEWSISRDIGHPEIWTERYHCPTWLDYLRQRERATEAERAVEREAYAFQVPETPLLVRRRLERPFGSVRWQEGSPDRDSGLSVPSAPTAI